MNCQSTHWTTTAVSAPSSIAPISALTTRFEAIFPVTVTVSGVVAGQTVAFKVVDHWIIPNQTARPGVVRVMQAGGRPTHAHQGISEVTVQIDGVPGAEPLPCRADRRAGQPTSGLEGGLRRPRRARKTE